MRKPVVVSVCLVVTIVFTACGGGSKAPTAEAFSDQLSSVCRTIGRGIGNLDEATSLDDVGHRATDASALFEDGLIELRKLAIPTSDQEFAGDAKDLIASFEDQLDTLDAIAKAAKASDQAAVDTKISKLTDQAADSNDLADSLDVSRCQFDPVFAATPPTTEAVVPLTLPLVTEPSETLPAETLPLGTASPTSNKQFESSSDLVPKGDYTFADAPPDAMTSFQSLLDLAPSMAAQSGRITGVDVFDTNGQVMGRVFAFQSDTDPLTPGSFEEATPYLTSDIAATPKKIGTLNGLTWSDPDGTTYFLVSLANVVLWALSPSADLLEPALRAWGESIAQ